MLSDGLLKSGQSVCELGSQDFVPGPYNGPLADLANWEGGARLFYEKLGFASYTCIDINGEGGAVRLDLNTTDIISDLEVDRQFDIVTNHGTTEHVFNQANCFRLMHAWTKPGGLMVHVLPTQDYVNHGFFNYQPVFFHDLAWANSYEELYHYKESDQFGVLLIVVLRKGANEGFKMPMQRIWMR
jgi:SAM-dependent methyltransferase